MYKQLNSVSGSKTGVKQEKDRKKVKIVYMKYTDNRINKKCICIFYIYLSEKFLKFNVDLCG